MQSQIHSEMEISLTKEQTEQKYFLTGKVTNETMLPLAGVQVKSENGAQMLTGEDGIYSLEVSKGESYNVSYTLDGYYEETREITITGENDSCDVILKKINLDASFQFEDADPKDIIYGEFKDGYVNRAVAEMIRMQRLLTQLLSRQIWMESPRMKRTADFRKRISDVDRKGKYKKIRNYHCSGDKSKR